VSLLSLLSQDLDVVTMDGITTDEFGNEVRGESARTTVRGLIQQAGTPREITVDRDTATSDWIAYFEAGVAIGHLDRVEDGEHVFEVLGKPYKARSPRGPNHQEVRLRLVEG
jgi:hypothetical protein